MKRYSITNHPIARIGFNVEENETGVWVMAKDALEEIAGYKVVQGLHRDAANTILDVNFEIQSELDKAKDLVRRMLPYVELAIYGEMTPVHYCDECKTIEPRHDADCGVGKLIAEARKILEVPDAKATD